MEGATSKGGNFKKALVLVGCVTAGVVLGSLIYSDVIKRYVIKK